MCSANLIDRLVHAVLSQPSALSQQSAPDGPGSSHPCIDGIAEAHPVPLSAIVRYETHISWIILFGDFVLKLKKPIKNPFLDYSTTSLREAACFAELQLNRRTAPTLYVAVVAIQEIDGNLRLVPAGAEPVTDAVEFAVLMRRFADDALMSQHLTHGQLTAHDIDQLAATIADFHDRAEVAGPTVAWGEASIVHHDQLDNLQALQSWTDPQDQTLCQQIEDWVTKQAALLSDVFVARKREGRVRACHGDLHLDNIAVWEDHWVPFDGIEFSDRLRWIDVQSDIAFTVMDLHARDADSWAARLLNAYLERSGDYGGLSVLRWYLVYRALVRAKVAMLRAAQENADDPDQQQQRANVGRYIRLADRLSRSAQRQLVITHGVSGSGKSYYSQQLVTQQGLIRVRSDVQRKRLFADSQTKDFLYSSVASEATYDRLANIAQQVLSAGFGVVIDATFLRYHDRQRFRRLADELNASFQILALENDFETLAKRIQDRQRAGKDASDADVDILRKQLATMETLLPDELPFVVSPPE